MQAADYGKELLKCVRCGSCKAYCPIYDEGLTEAMGARGRLTLLRGLLTEQLKPSPLLKKRIFDCILCGSCENLCPPDLDITEAIYYGRKLLWQSDRRIKYLRLLMRFAVRQPMLSFKTARMLQHVGLTPQKIVDLLRASCRLARRERIDSARSEVFPFPVMISESPLRDDQQVYKPERKVGRVAFFTGCSINFIFPSLGMSLINVLLRLGYEVVLPKGEVCCGAPFRGLGFEEDAVELAKKNREIFNRLNAEAVITLCPTCLLSIKAHYPKLIGKGIDNAVDISSFLLDRLEPGSLARIESFSTATYHDPCHLNYSFGIKKEPRELMRQSGIDVIDTEGEGCCGFGGLFSLNHRELSRRLLGKRVDAYVRTGAEAVVTSCPGCIMQLGAGIKDRPVLHLIEVVEEALCMPRT